MSDLQRQLSRISDEKRFYVLRYLLRHLADQKQFDRLYSLLTDIFFLEAKMQELSVFDLAADFTHAVEAIPDSHPHHKILRLLEEAIRRDIHFVDRHTKDYPQGLFQCLWNSCWWYDCPQAAKHYKVPKVDWKESPPWQQRGPKLYKLLEEWCFTKKERTPGFLWVRSLRPPPFSLKTPQVGCLRGHTYPVTAVAFSPDGLCVASGSRDGTVRTWDLRSGNQILCFRVEGKMVETVAYSPDGQHIAFGSYQIIHVGDVQTGAVQMHLEGHEFYVSSLAYSPDGQRIVSGSDDHTVRTWDTKSGSQLLCIHAHEYPVRSVAYSLDGQCIISADDTTIRIWDSETGKELHRLHGPKDKVPCVALSPDGRRIMSGWNDRALSWWDIRSGRLVLRICTHHAGVGCLAYSPDGRRIVAGFADTVRVLDSITGEDVACFDGHEARVNCVVYSPDGRLIASGAEDYTVRIWDARSTRSSVSSHVQKGYVSCVVFSRDGERIATGASHGTVCVWDTRTGERIWLLCGHRELVSSVAFSPDGQYLVSGSWDTTICVWDMQNGSCFHRLLEHDYAIEGVEFSQNGAYIISGSQDDVIREWDIKTGKCMSVRNGKWREKLVRAVEYSECTFRAVGRNMVDTIIQSGISGESVAWYPVAFFDIYPHRSDLIWAGNVGGHFYIFTLEGAADWSESGDKGTLYHPGMPESIIRENILKNGGNTRNP